MQRVTAAAFLFFCWQSTAFSQAFEIVIEGTSKNTGKATVRTDVSVKYHVLDAYTMGQEIGVTKRARIARKTVVEDDDDDKGDDQDDNEAATTPDAGGNADVEMGELVAAEDTYAS